MSSVRTTACLRLMTTTEVGSGEEGDGQNDENGPDKKTEQDPPKRIADRQRMPVEERAEFTALDGFIQGLDPFEALDADRRRRICGCVAAFQVVEATLEIGDQLVLFEIRHDGLTGLEFMTVEHNRNTISSVANSPAFVAKWQAGNANARPIPRAPVTARRATLTASCRVDVSDDLCLEFDATARQGNSSGGRKMAAPDDLIQVCDDECRAAAFHHLAELVSCNNAVVSIVVGDDEMRIFGFLNQSSADGHRPFEGLHVRGFAVLHGIRSRYVQERHNGFAARFQGSLQKRGSGDADD